MAKVICRFCGENTNTAQSVPINRIGLDTVSEYCNDCAVCKKNVMCNSCLDAHEMRSCENAGYCPVCERSNGWVCRYCGDLTSSPQVRAGTQYCDNCVKAHDDSVPLLRGKLITLLKPPCETAGLCEI